MVARFVPWWVKIGIKVVLSRLPVNHHTFWRRFGLFRHGYMDSTQYIISNFESLFYFGGVSTTNVSNKTMVELGPGDSNGTAVVAASYGLKPILIDVDDFATHDMDTYRDLMLELSLSSGVFSKLNAVNSFEELLSVCDAKYLTNGTQSLSRLSDSSVDFIISQACLEHVKKCEFDTLVGELYRISISGSLNIHSIDFKDHLSYSLNNLRFSEEFWESQIVSSSGFYTNRLRYPDMKSAFVSAGFEIVKEDIFFWDSVPLPKHKLHSIFHKYDEQDLRIKEAKIVLRK